MEVSAGKAIPPPSTTGRGLRGVWLRASVALSAAWAAFTGVLPHVLHHVGPLAGAALFAGVGGSLLFGAIGLVAAIPFLLRLRRRFDSWRAPAVALAVFVAVFSVSTLVIGPAISGSDDGGSTANQPTNSAPPGVSESAHEQHH
jgi:hypothetical protein